MKYGILLVLLLFPPPTFAQVTAETCQPFYQALESVPHESIFQRTGFFNSQVFETSAYGCFMIMNTDVDRLGDIPLPDLSGAPGTAFYEAGWRANPKYAADGAGTGVVGLDKDGTLCLVYSERPSYANDDGSFVEDFHIKVKVECMEGATGPSPRMILRKAQ